MLISATQLYGIGAMDLPTIAVTICILAASALTQPTSLLLVPLRWIRRPRSARNNFPEILRSRFFP
jgi:hypothetical protein